MAELWTTHELPGIRWDPDDEPDDDWDDRLDDPPPPRPPRTRPHRHQLHTIQDITITGRWL